MKYIGTIDMKYIAKLNENTFCIYASLRGEKNITILTVNKEQMYFHCTTFYVNYVPRDTKLRRITAFVCHTVICKHCMYSYM